MSRVPTMELLLTDSFPRVSGDEPFALKKFLSICGFSPRERG